MVLSLENREGNGGKKEVREIQREEIIRIWYLLRYKITKEGGKGGEREGE